MEKCRKQDNDSTRLQRTRLDVLFSQGILHPLITVIAGTGYGKTCAVEMFLDKISAHSVWLSFNLLGNYTERFWQMFKDTIIQGIPALEAALKNKTFPRTPKEMDAFLHCFAESLYSDEQLILVLDNAQYITNDEIIHFLFSILEAGLENFCMIVISDLKKHMYLRPKMPHGAPFRITAEDLRCSDEEVRQWLEMNHIATSDDIVSTAQEITGGWPLAVRVLTNHWQDSQKLQSREPFDMFQMLDLFYGEYYQHYSKEMQLLLVKLSLLPLFSLEIVSAIGGCNLFDAVALIDTNPFIITDYTNATYSFQTVYHRFLLKCFVIDDDEQQRIYSLAAKYYQQNGLTLEALQLCIFAGEYDEAYSIMRSYPYERVDRETSQLFMNSYAQFPEAFLAERPDAQIYLALLQQLFRKWDESEAMFNALLEEHGDEPEIAGEAYLALGELAFARDPDLALQYYKKASACLPDGSAFRPARSLYLYNKSLFRLLSTEAGSLDHNLRRAADIRKYSSVVYRNMGESWYYLLLAEAAYYRFDIATAQKMAQKAVYDAAIHARYDMQCSAWFLLLKIHVMRGNMAGAEGMERKIDTLISDKRLSSLYTFRDCVAGWLHIKINNYCEMPRWLTEISSDEMTKLYPTSEHDLLLRVFYQIDIGDYDHALALIDVFLPYSEPNLFWIVKLNLYIAEAIAHSKTDNPQEALRAFKNAYSLAYGNQIVTPFIETGSHMRSLIGLIEKVDNHGMDEEWLKYLYTKSNTYAKRLSALSNDFAKAKTDLANEREKPALTPREIVVLEQLVQGMKYEEISNIMGISINGVKKHITSIYSKLGAINRADAIYIAMSEGLIK